MWHKEPCPAHCNTVQHTATHYNTLQCTATHCNTIQHNATHCNTLQHTATHCNTLQRSDTTHSCTPPLIHVRYTRQYVVAHTHSQVWQDPVMYATTHTLMRRGTHTFIRVTCRIHVRHNTQIIASWHTHIHRCNMMHSCTPQHTR